MSEGAGHPLIVTTSWDDGHVLDLKLAELLSKYGCRGTFFVPRQYLNDALDPGHVVELATRFEIGAHTLTHPYLPDLDLGSARDQIRGSRTFLEDLLGGAVPGFCYPAGGHTPALRAIVQDSGFVYARGVRGLSLDTGPRFAMRTTAHVFTHRTIDKLKASIRWRAAWARPYWSWHELALRSFDRALKLGGVWHLWGHSWEVEERRQWGELETVLAHVARRPDVAYLSNVDTWRVVDGG